MSKRILMIDDDHGPFEYYVEALRESDFQVEQIDQSEEFLRRLEVWQGLRPDLVIMDIMMPVTGRKLNPKDVNWGLHTGLVLISRVLETWPGIPLMVLTNQDDMSVLGQVPAQISVLHKFETAPFHLADLVDAELRKDSNKDGKETSEKS